MPSASEVIRCPLCDLPHLPTAEICDSCDQPLNHRPDLEEMEDEKARRKVQIVVAIVAIVAMVALNLWLGGSTGVFVVLLAPLVWLGTGWHRHRVLARRLARLKPPTT